MRYLVTGGAGAIGNRLIRLLLEKKDTERIFAVDDLSGGHAWLLPKDERLLLYHSPRPIMHEEIRDAVVFHLAAHFANEKSVKDPLQDLKDNGQFTLHLLCECVHTKPKRIVYAGAACSVGHEDTPYQIHKALGESYCRYFRTLGVPATICRFHNTYGPGEVPGRYRNVIANWVWKALHDEPLVIRGDGTQERDFVYVDDLAASLMHAEGNNLPIVIGSARHTQIRELAELILRLTQSRSVVKHADFKPWDRTGFADKALVPAAMGGGGLGAARPLQDGLMRTIEWQRENEARIRGCMQ